MSTESEQFKASLVGRIIKDVFFWDNDDPKNSIEALMLDDGTFVKFRLSVELTKVRSRVLRQQRKDESGG